MPAVPDAHTAISRPVLDAVEDMLEMACDVGDQNLQARVEHAIAGCADRLTDLAVPGSPLSPERPVILPSGGTTPGDPASCRVTASSCRRAAAILTAEGQAADGAREALRTLAEALDGHADHLAAQRVGQGQPQHVSAAHRRLGHACQVVRRTLRSTARP